MTNTTILRGACPAPFLQLSNFPSTDGCESVEHHAYGRYAYQEQFSTADSALLLQRLKALSIVVYHALWPTGSIQTVSRQEVFVEHDTHTGLGFKSVPRITSWINVAGLVCAGSLLVSYFVLPTEKTNRHYLTIGMIISVCFLEVRWGYRRSHWMICTDWISWVLLFH